jgi:protein-tyrosine phosphatase
MNPSLQLTHEPAPMSEFAFESIVNARDLSAVDTSRIRSGVVMRSAVPTFATSSDRSQLQRSGVTAVIDLRSSEEREALPSLTGLARSTAHHLPLVSGPWDYSSLDNGEPVAQFLARQYFEMLTNAGDQIREALNVVTNNSGATLIHCTAGKDRTGVLVALLGVIAGASVSQIVRDYERSSASMSALVDLLRSRASTSESTSESSVPPIEFANAARQALLFAAPATALEAALAKVFPSPHRYFDEIGYSRSGRRDLQAKLITATNQT